MAPFGKACLHGVLEIGTLSSGACVGVVVERGGGACQLLVLTFRKMLVFHHERHDDIATLMAVFRVDDGVVSRGCLEDAHQHGRLVGGELGRCDVEIGLACRLDAIAVAAKVHGVGIHGEDFLLVIDHLYFGSQNPFLAFHDEHPQSGNVAEQSV